MAPVASCSAADLHSVRFSGAVLALCAGTPCYFVLVLKESIYACVWLRWVFVAVRGLSLAAGSRGLLFVVVRGLLIVLASLVSELGL